LLAITTPTNLHTPDKLKGKIFQKKNTSHWACL